MFSPVDFHSLSALKNRLQSLFFSRVFHFSPFSGEKWKTALKPPSKTEVLLWITQGKGQKRRVEKKFSPMNVDRKTGGKRIISEGS